MKITGTNEELEQSKKKTKKIIIIISSIIAVLLILCVVLVVLIFYSEQKAFKLYVDGKLVTKYETDTFVFEGDEIYISIKDFAKLLGYSAYNGGYLQYSEDTTQCYIQNENEVASFTMDSNKVYKTPPESQTDYQYFDIDKPVKNKNEKLYTTVDGIKVGCNVSVSYTEANNTLRIYSLEKLVTAAQTKFDNSAIQEKKKTDFQNQKTILYNMIVVKNVKNTDTGTSSKNIRYGVSNLQTGEEIIGTKYTSIEFIESTNEFLVKTEDNKVGIMTAKGETKVKPQYDELKQVDKDLNLYLVTSGNKKGIIETNGKILIYPEYDKIGLDTTNFKNDNIKNPYLLYNNCIPVKKNDKWGLFDKRGNIILPIEYTSFGCVSNDKTINNLLIIPEINGIVVYKEDKENKTKLYGIVNSEGKELIPMLLSSVYSVTVNGKNEYTMVNNGNSFDVLDYVRRYVLTDNNQTNTQTNSQAERN